MLKQRLLTAFSAAIVFLIATLWAPMPYLLLFFSAIVLAAGREWAQLLGWSKAKAWGYGALCVLAGLAVILPSPNPGASKIVLVLSAALWLFFVPWQLFDFSQKGKLALTNTALALLGALFLSSFLLAVVLLRTQLEGGRLFALFALVWMMDSAAFFCGRRWGKVPLAATISPKKTREGFVGALVIGLGLAWALSAALPVAKSWFLPLTAVVLVYSVLGDLWESVLKRRAGVKDSGTLLPGHGGILDRIDSWLPALPLWALGWTFWG